MKKKKRRKRKPEVIERRKKLAAWSKRVRTRDGWRCQYCGDRNPRLNAHHLLPKEIFPELQFQDWVGISLCPFKCHRRVAHHNGVVFTIWLMENKPEQFNKIKEFLKQKEIEKCSLTNDILEG